MPLSIPAGIWTEILRFTRVWPEPWHSLQTFSGIFPFALALGTGCHPDKLAERGLGCLPHLAGPAAARTGVEPFCLAAGSAAGSTGFGMHHLDLAIHTGNCILKPDLDPHEEICTRLGAGAPLAPPKKSKMSPKPEKSEENPPPPYPPPPVYEPFEALVKVS